MTPEKFDITAIRMRLNNLRRDFDASIRNGHDLEYLKKIHMEIKELECHLNVLEYKNSADTSNWQRGSPYNEGRPYL